MKNVYIMRHAKTEEGQTKADRDRALTNRGWRAAGVVGLYFAQQKIIPDIIFCSPALRTTQTMQQVMKMAEWNCPVQQPEGLYQADNKYYRNLLSDLGDEYKRVLIIGHNPTVQTFASSVCEHLDGDDVNRLFQGFPTGAVAALQFDCKTWAEWDDENIPTQFQFFIEPADLV